MLFIHFLLHITLVLGACNATERNRRLGSSYTPSKSRLQKGQGSDSVPSADYVVPGGPGASNRTSQGSLAINKLGAAEDTGGNTGGKTGGAPPNRGDTGGSKGGETGGSTGDVPGGEAGSTPDGDSSSGSTGGTPSIDAPPNAVSSNPPNNLEDGNLNSPKQAASSPVGGSTGGGMKASFTQYGGCNTASVACGFYGKGYNAAISQAVFGVGSGAGAGPACGTCYQLNPDAPGAKSIKVKINNLCPVEGNPICASAAEENVNFDLCQDDGTADALFASADSRQVNGTASLVAC